MHQKEMVDLGASLASQNCWRGTSRAHVGDITKQMSTLFSMHGHQSWC